MIRVLNEQQNFQEALQVLVEHLGVAKAARFLSTCQVGEGDYLTLRTQIFGQETVSELFAQIQAHEQQTKPEQ